MIEKSISEIRFILDVHLGKLAKFLRLFGFDSFCDSELDDRGIIQFALSDNRVILTRDKELLKSSDVRNGYRILSQNPHEQLIEVFISFDLKNRLKPFTRCTECNGLLQEVSKDEIVHRLSPKTTEYYSYFKKCPDCDRIYWEGSHYERMRKFIDNIIKDVN